MSVKIKQVTVAKVMQLEVMLCVLVKIPLLCFAFLAFASIVWYTKYRRVLTYSLRL